MASLFDESRQRGGDRLLRVGTTGALVALVAAGTLGMSTGPQGVGTLDRVVIGQESAPVGFNNLSADANSSDLTVLEEGVLPTTFRGQPNATYAYDRDLLVSAPKLVRTSPETVVYRISPKAVWSDGVPIDASDFIYNWVSQSGSDARYQSAAGGTGYANIARITGSGPRSQTVTVVFKKNKSYADYQSLFGPLLPAHLFDPRGTTAARAESNFNVGMSSGIRLGGGAPFSGGPYIQTGYSPGQSLTLGVNPRWWGAKPHVRQLVFRFIADTTQYPNALQDGELDVVNIPATADAVTKTRSVSRVTTTLYSQLAFEHIDYNFHNQFLADAAVRKAFSTAINVRQLIAATIGQFDPSIGSLGNRFFLTHQPGYVDNSDTYGKGDATAADALLASDGYVRSGDYYAKDGKTLEVSITTKNGNPLRVLEEEVMQAQLATAGIKLDIANTDQNLGAFLSAHDFDIALFAWVGGPALSQESSIYETPPAGGSSNFQFLSDPGVDSLLQRADGNFSTAARIAQYNQADKRLWDDAATLPLFQKPELLAYPKTLANLRANATQDGFTYNVQQWGQLAG